MPYLKCSSASIALQRTREAGQPTGSCSMKSCSSQRDKYREVSREGRRRPSLSKTIGLFFHSCDKHIQPSCRLLPHLCPKSTSQLQRGRSHCSSQALPTGWQHTGVLPCWGLGFGSSQLCPGSFTTDGEHCSSEETRASHCTNTSSLAGQPPSCRVTHQQNRKQHPFGREIKALHVADTLNGTADFGDSLDQGQLELYVLRTRREKQDDTPAELLKGPKGKRLTRAPKDN